MDYELAKELKEAGFPDYEEDWVDEIGHVVIHPTLSELIKACGDEFVALEKWGGRFYAYGKDVAGYSKIENATPEEAVARLYLIIKTNG